MVAAARQRDVGGSMAEHRHWSSRHFYKYLYIMGLTIV
jgi:hypothetical protein